MLRQVTTRKIDASTNRSRKSLLMASTNLKTLKKKPHLSDNLRTVLAWASPTNSFKSIRRPCTKTISRLLLNAMIRIRSAWMSLSGSMGRASVCHWTTAAKTRLICAECFAKSRRMYQGLRALSRMKSLRYCYKQAKIQYSISCPPSQSQTKSLDTLRE